MRNMYVQNGMIFEIFDHHAIFVGLQQEYKKTTLEIPAFVQAVPVTAIQNDACSSNRKIQRLILPHTIQKVGNGAFWCCKNLEIVQLLSSLENQFPLIIGEYAFSGCSKLVSFHAKTELDVQEEAFTYSYKLGLLDGYVKKIGARAFNDTALDMLVLAENAKVLKEGLYGSKIKDIICIRDASFHNSATYIIQAKGINIHCPQTSNVVELAYLGVNICTN